jgi:hypothetical protein
MKSRPKLILALAFVGSLWMVGLLTFLPPLGLKLRGVTVPPPTPVWDWPGVASGETFRMSEAWFDHHVGLRNLWVRLDNQLNYSLFRETALRDEGTRVVAGPGDWLYEHHYIRYAVEPSKLREPQLREALARMRAVQDKLAARGIPFLLVVAPSKVEVYPEHAPAVHFAGRKPSEVTTSFERARPLFKEYGINLYDGPARYLQWKESLPDNLFVRSGTHWSYYSVHRVMDELRDWLNPRLRHPIPEFKLKRLRAASPRFEDTDLIGLMNLLVSAPYEHPSPFPELEAQTAVPPEELPRILWVHDSFGWMPVNLLYQANAARPSHSLYYFSLETYEIPNLKPTTPKAADIEWETYLRDYDAVVMVWTEIAFDHMGWGFFEALERSLP